MKRFMFEMHALVLIQVDADSEGEARQLVTEAIEFLNDLDAPFKPDTFGDLDVPDENRVSDPVIDVGFTAELIEDVEVES